MNKYGKDKNLCYSYLIIISYETLKNECPRMFDYKKLSTEALMEIYDAAKREVISRKKLDIEERYRELRAIENEHIGITQRKRNIAAPHFVGYYVYGKIEKTEGENTLCWARWSRGRFPPPFRGFSETKLKNFEVPINVFLQEIIDGAKTVKPKYGFDSDGRTLEELFTLHTNLSVVEIRRILDTT